MEQQIKIYELRRHRSGSVFHVYEVFDGPNRLAFGEYSRDYSACMVTTGNGFGIAELTGDPKVLKDPGPGAAVGYAFRLDVKTADVPEWIRPAFIAWKADRENDDEDAGGDRIRFDREDGLYYAVVRGREFGGWQTREQARGGLLVEQKRADDRAAKSIAENQRVILDDSGDALQYVTTDVSDIRANDDAQRIEGRAIIGDNGFVSVYQFPGMPRDHWYIDDRTTSEPASSADTDRDEAIKRFFVGSGYTIAFPCDACGLVVSQPSKDAHGGNCERCGEPIRGAGVIRDDAATEAAVLEMTTRAVLAGYVEQEAAGGPITSETIHKARRVAVMAIDAAARILLQAAANDIADNASNEDDAA